MTLNIVPVTAGTAALWGQIHNRVIPAGPLSEDEVRQRMRRHRLTLAYDGDVVVGNATLRPPTSGSRTATVIVRVLPELRGRGHGTEYAAWILAEAERLGIDRLETVVLGSNVSGLRFALRRGFQEFDRYTLDGGSTEYVELWLRSGGSAADHDRATELLATRSAREAARERRLP